MFETLDHLCFSTECFYLSFCAFAESVYFNSKLFGEKVENLRLYVSGQNLHTWTKYIGYNPEANARPTNALSQGEDYGSYPLPRTIIAGLNLTF